MSKRRAPANKRYYILMITTVDIYDTNGVYVNLSRGRVHHYIFITLLHCYYINTLLHYYYINTLLRY